jgi:hypothetical protein
VSRSSKEKRNKRRESKEGKPLPQAQREPSWKWWTLVILAVLAVVVVLPGLYWDWKPRMIIEMQQNDPNPFYAEIVVKNDGRFCMRGVQYTFFISQGIKNNLIVPKSPESTAGVLTDNVIGPPGGFLGEVCPGQNRTFTLPFKGSIQRYVKDMHICFTISFRARWPFGRQQFKSGFFITDEPPRNRWIPRACPDDEPEKKPSANS